MYFFFKDDNKNDIDVINKTVEVRKTSVSTVRRIINVAKNSNLLVVFRTLGKKRSGKKKIAGIDSFYQSVVRRIHNNITNNKVPYCGKAS